MGVNGTLQKVQEQSVIGKVIMIGPLHLQSPNAMVILLSTKNFSAVITKKCGCVLMFVMTLVFFHPMLVALVSHSKSVRQVPQQILLSVQLLTLPRVLEDN